MIIYAIYKHWHVITHFYSEYKFGEIRGLTAQTTLYWFFLSTDDPVTGWKVYTLQYFFKLRFWKPQWSFLILGIFSHPWKDLKINQPQKLNKIAPFASYELMDTVSCINEANTIILFKIVTMGISRRQKAGTGC